MAAKKVAPRESVPRRCSICLESFKDMSSLSTTVAIADSSALFRLGVRNMAAMGSNRGEASS